MPKKKDNGLNPQQEKFCKLYATDKEFFGNGVQAYAEAYAIDLRVRGAYQSARADASRLLTNANILERINKLLDEGGLNDSFVDKQLLFVINQNADFSSKMAAIREYNKLKQRVTERLEHTGKDGQPIEQNMSITYMPEPLDDNYFRRPANDTSQ